MAVQLQHVVPNPSLITWCTHCGTSSVGKVEREPEILKKLGTKCVEHEWLAMAPFNGVHGNHNPPIKISVPTVETKSYLDDSPPCNNCGSLTRRDAACYLCDNCGSSSGCS